MSCLFQDTSLGRVNFRTPTGYRFGAYLPLNDVIFKYVHYRLPQNIDEWYLNGVIGALFDLCVDGGVLSLLDFLGAFLLFDDLFVEVGGGQVTDDVASELGAEAVAEVVEPAH